jgi:hypothetical protein
MAAVITAIDDCMTEEACKELSTCSVPLAPDQRIQLCRNLQGTVMDHVDAWGLPRMATFPWIARGLALDIIACVEGRAVPNTHPGAAASHFGNQSYEHLYNFLLDRL